MTDSPATEPAPSPPDETNRLWQHALHEERLFHDRMNFFSAMEVGLLGVFAILYNKEPSLGVLVPLMTISLGQTLLWFVVQVRHWTYCVYLNNQVRLTVPEYRRTIAGLARLGRRDGLTISRPLSYAVPLLFATVWLALLGWLLVR